MVENIGKSAKSDKAVEPGHLRPGSEAELGQRIRRLVELIGSREKAAKIAGVSKGQISRYVTAETTKVPLEPLLRLCEASGARIEWLATGRDPMLEGAAVQDEAARYSLGETFEARIERLQEVNSAVLRVSRELGHRVSYDVLARIQGVAYASGLDEEAIAQLVRMVDMAYDEGYLAGCGAADDNPDALDGVEDR